MRVSSISTYNNYQNYQNRNINPKSYNPQFSGYTFKTNHMQDRLLKLNPVMYYLNKLFDKSLVASRRRIRQLGPTLAPMTKEIKLGKDVNSQTYAWDINPDNRKKYVMVFHGASQNVSNNQNLYREIVSKTDYAVLAPEYRGFGKNPPADLSSQTFLEDTTVALDYLKEKNIDLKDITVIGYSFGSIPSSQLVKHNPGFERFILLSAMDSFSSGTFDLVRASKNRMPKFVQKLNSWFPFLKSPLESSLNSVKYLKNIETPIDIIHSKTDRMVKVSVVDTFKNVCKNIHSISILSSGGHRMDQNKLDKVVSILNNH